MKLNRMICPNCAHETLTDCAYTRCDSCGVTFYASQSRDAVHPQTSTIHATRIYINGVEQTRWPVVGPTVNLT